MVSVPVWDQVGRDALYQGDRMRFVAVLGRDITGMTARYLIKKRRGAPDSAAIIDTAAGGKGTLTVTDAATGTVEVIIDSPAADNLVGKLEHEFHVVSAGQRLTEWEGTVEFKARL